MKENKENDIENENNELVKTIFYESNEKGIEENNSEFKFDNENHGFLNWFCCHKQNNSINNFEANKYDSDIYSMESTIEPNKQSKNGKEEVFKIFMENINNFLNEYQVYVNNLYGIESDINNNNNNTNTNNINNNNNISNNMNIDMNIELDENINNIK